LGAISARAAPKLLLRRPRGSDIIAATRPEAFMFIPTRLLGIFCLIVALLLTFVLRIQRGRFQNQLWDFITLALFVVGAWWVNYWDPLSNLVVGAVAGLAAIVIRDVRLWAARFRGQVYRRTHRYYWYGRAGSWFGGRRRRRY
jgi:hypothetical protein